MLPTGNGPVVKAYPASSGISFGPFVQVGTIEDGVTQLDQDALVVVQDCTTDQGRQLIIDHEPI